MKHQFTASVKRGALTVERTFVSSVDKEGNASTKEVGVACRSEGYRENRPVLK